MKKIKTDKVAAHVTLPTPDTTHYAQWAGDTIKYHSDDQIYEFASARVKAALASNRAAALVVGDVERTGPGTPSARLTYLLGELRNRFPGAHGIYDSSSPEPKYLAAIEAALASNKAAENATDTLVAVLDAIGYTEEFAESHPSLKVSEGVKLFLTNKTAAGAVAWIQGEHLEKAKQAPFLCRVEPAFREGMGFVPIHTHPAAAQPSRAEVLEEAALICDGYAERLHGGITENARVPLLIAADSIRALKDKQ